MNNARKLYKLCLGMIDGSIYSCLICENRRIVFALVMLEKLMGIETALFYRCSVIAGFSFSEVLEAPTLAGIPKISSAPSLSDLLTYPDPLPTNADTPNIIVCAVSV